MNRSIVAVAAGFLLGVTSLASLARAAPGDVPGRKPEVWAVVIGIDHYKDQAIPPRRGSIRDGNAVARWFTATARWDDAHVLVMNENGDPRPGRPEEPIRALYPSRENLDWALKQWLGHRLRPGDLAVVYFAGRSAIADDRERLLPIDAKAADVATTGWSPEDAIDDLARKAQSQARMLFWLDIDASPLGGARPAAEPVDPINGVRLLDRLTRWPGASAWRTYGRPGVDEGLGPFLSALTRGLGTRPNNLLSCLDRMRQDPALKEHGFQVRGGISPLLTLWPDHLLPDHKFKPTLVLQLGHADAVTAVAHSPDGETMVTAAMDSTVRIWRLRDGVWTLLRVLPHHMIGVTALAMSPDGRLVASGDGSGRVRVWDQVEQRESLWEGAPPHRQRITSLAFMPNRGGSRLVSLDQDGQARLWDTTGRALKSDLLLPLLPTGVVLLSAARREGPAALALADPGGRLILVGGDGRPRPFLDGTGVRSTAMHLSADGRRLAAGDENGAVRVWDVETKEALFRHDYPEKIGAIRVGPAGELAVGSGDRLYLADQGQDGPGLVLEGVGDEISTALFSGDGRWLAALTVNGNQHLWDVSDRAQPSPRALAIEGRSSGATCLEFSRDDRGLCAGEGDGGLRGWDLPGGRERLRIPAHRGQVEGLAVSPDGDSLLQVTHDGRALVWDMKEGRGATTLPGRWAAGAFLPDNSRLAMARHANDGGDVVLVDRKNEGVPIRFERPPVRGSREASRAAFGRVAVAGDGRTVAASTAAAGEVELVCVWDIQGGAPRVLRGHTRTITALAFAGDGRSLLTASEDGTAQLWDLGPDAEAPAPPRERPSLVLDARPAKAITAKAITAAAICPTDPHRVVTAHWAPGQFGLGQVVLWDRRAGEPFRPKVLDEFSGRPHAVAFTPDGRWVAVAGQDKRLSLWSLEANRAVRAEFDPPEHQHTEQVKALAAWSGTPLIASGGDDTTVRLWTLDPSARKATLLGMLVAGPAAPEEAAGWERERDRDQDRNRDRNRNRNRFASSSTRANWVAFTPDGVYDSSLEGDRMVSFVIGQEVRPLEQYAGQFRRYQLTNDLRQASRPRTPAQTAPPALVIDPPPVPDLQDRDTELRISLADPSLILDELRLYQDGKPVQNGRDFRPLEGRGRYVAQVTLHGGVNRFYAMAGRPNDIDARSQDVLLRYNGPEADGQVHVLAIGVKDYAKNALRYPSKDAIRIADHLHRYGVEGVDRPGKKIVLTDGDVTELSVENAFAELRRAVKKRPEDTVVVFLAGHTDVLKDPDGRERFSLLLPSFPFPADAPALADNRGLGVAGAAGGRVAPGLDLPFYRIYRNLSQLDALQRLIIIDACQAEAIHDDPGVRRIRQAVELETHRARTSYLLAARRGEPASESSLLEHGLLTYVLLKGMQATGLNPLPMSLPAFEESPDADDDGDGVVTTSELHAYTDRALPQLASRLPDLTRRSGLDAARTSPEPLRLQASAGPAFQLVRLPKDKDKVKASEE